MESPLQSLRTLQGASCRAGASAGLTAPPSSVIIPNELEKLMCVVGI